MQQLTVTVDICIEACLNSQHMPLHYQTSHVLFRIFLQGDMITILKRVDDNWYEGELNDQIGIFPTNYIEVIQEPMVVELEPKSETKPSNPDIE